MPIYDPRHHPRQPTGLKFRHYLFFVSLAAVLFGIVILAFNLPAALITIGLGGMGMSIASCITPDGGMRE